MKKVTLIILIALLAVASVVLAAAFVPKMLEDRHLTVGITATSDVICFKNSQNEWQGVACDTIRAIAEKTGYTVEFKKINAADCENLLKKGDIDCYLASTDARIEKTTSTEVFLYSLQNVIYKNIFALDNIEPATLKNYTCAVVSDSFNEQYLTEQGVKSIKKFQSTSDVITAVNSGACKVGIIDFGVYLSVIKGNEAYKEIMSGVLTDSCPFRLVFREKDAPRVNKLNDSIETLKSDDTYMQILEEYNFDSQQPFMVY